MPCYTPDNYDHKYEQTLPQGITQYENEKLKKGIYSLEEYLSEVESYLCTLLNAIRSKDICYEWENLMHGMNLSAEEIKKITDWYASHCKKDEKRIMSLLGAIVKGKIEIDVDNLRKIEEIIDKQVKED